MALRIRLRWTLPAPGLAIGVVPSIKPGHPPARCVGGIVAAHPATVASSSLVCCVSAGRGVAYLIDGLRRPAVDQMAARRCAQRSLPQNPGDAMRFQAKKAPGPALILYGTVQPLLEVHHQRRAARIYILGIDQ